MGTIRVRVIATVIVIASLVAVAISVSSIILGFNSGRQQVANQLEVITFLKQTKIDAWIANLETDLASLQLQEDTLLAMRLLLQPTAFRDLYKEQVSKDFTQTIELTGLFSELFLLNADGEIILSTNPAQTGTNYRRAEFFQKGLYNQFIQPPEYSSALDQVVMYAAMPVVHQNGETVLGVLAGRVNLEKLDEIVLEQIGDDQPGVTYYLVDAGNILLTETPNASIGDSVQSAGIDAALAATTPGRVTGPELYSNFHDAPVVGVFHWLPQIQAALLTEKNQVDAFRPTINTLLLNISVALVAVLLTIAVGLMFTRTITNPLIKLTTATRKIAAGDLNLVVDVEGSDEVNELGRSFNAMTEQLRDLVANLEQRVAARTQRLEIVAGLSERLNAILDVEDLAAEVVDQIKDKFGYYHAHIYLLDPQHTNLVVVAGTGEAGAVMKEKGHSIPLNAKTSLVARAARNREVVKVDNVREAPDWLPNALLPETYSEMAVPIVLDDQVVGVLDVQQNKTAGLDDGDANLLRSLAGQVAVAVRNARTFAETQQALAEVRAIQEQYVQQAWNRQKITHNNVGRADFLQAGAGTPEPLIVQARNFALAQQQPTLVTLAGSDNPADPEQQQALVAPVILRDVPIGHLQLHGIDATRQWTDDELDLIDIVIDQVAQIAENLRLFDETQQRASREQLMGQVGDKLRRAPDMETLLQTGVEEIARLLGPARTFVTLGSPDSLVESAKAKPEKDVPDGLNLHSATSTNGRGDKQL
jgi:GAF domain-containing protein/HAMP domain-containing protein